MDILFNKSQKRHLMIKTIPLENNKVLIKLIIYFILLEFCAFYIFAIYIDKKTTTKDWSEDYKHYSDGGIALTILNMKLLEVMIGIINFYIFHYKQSNICNFIIFFNCRRL